VHVPASLPAASKYTICSSETHAPSSPHAPEVQSLSTWQPLQTLLSQIAFVGVVQSADSTHSTQLPLDVSQVGVASKRSQSPDVAQPSQTSVVMLHTG
jgi:hypothetical protein